MKIEKKIELMLKDKNFVDFCNGRISNEVKECLMHGEYDHFFDVLDEGFETNDNYVVPLVEYLMCKLHYAKLQKNRKKRERLIWWIYTQLYYEGHYTKVFRTYFEPLVKETKMAVYGILRKEYIKSLKKSV